MTTTGSNDSGQLGLMVWIMHRFAEVFREQALLKGGMQLALFSSERATNDLDYVFVPYGSKKKIANQIQTVLEEIPDSQLESSLHSSSGRFLVRQGSTAIQIEFNVAKDVPSEPISTARLADKAGVLPQVIRVMSRQVALAHKLAAWNERRLVRDLYDAYFWHAHLSAKPDMSVLKSRLGRIQSRLPKLKKRKKMSLEEFSSELRSAIHKLDEKQLNNQLRPLLPPERIDGLLPVLQAGLSELVDSIQS